MNVMAPSNHHGRLLIYCKKRHDMCEEGGRGEQVFQHLFVCTTFIPTYSMKSVQLVLHCSLVCGDVMVNLPKYCLIKLGIIYIMFIS